MKPSEKSTSSFLCDEQGAILQVLHDGLEIFHEERTAHKLFDLVPDTDLLKAHKFLEVLVQKSTAYDWELNMVFLERLEVLHFAGIRVCEAYVVIAARSRSELADIDRALLQLSPHEDPLRVSPLIERSRHVAADSHSLDEMARMLNELAVRYREVVKQQHNEQEHERKLRKKASVLSTRQRDVLRLLAAGESAKQIAAKLGISKRTVEYHKYRLMRLLGVDTMAGLVQFATKTHITQDT